MVGLNWSAVHNQPPRHAGLTPYPGNAEVKFMCITQRRLERMDEPIAKRKVAEMIRKRAEISAGRRPAPTHRV